MGSINCDGPRCFCCCNCWVPIPQGNYEDPEPLYRCAMEIKETVLGEDHPQYSITLNNLAVLLEKWVRARVSRRTPVESLDGIDVLPPCWGISSVSVIVPDTGVLLFSVR